MDQCEQNDKDNSKMARFHGRILRSRQHRRPFEDNRPIKRLFTPEIKRYLKSWLVRRRENPYPSREEKIELATQTGLTYIQICNWFANWRRKLKNSGKNINKFTWSNLIRSYNDQAFGNVEHLSISSDDSIWEEPDVNYIKGSETKKNSQHNHSIDHCYTSHEAGVKKTQETAIPVNGIINTVHESTAILTNTEFLHQCFQISSTSDFIKEPKETVETKKKLTLFRKYQKKNEKIYSKYLMNKRKHSNRDKNCNYKRIVNEKRTNSNRVICSNEFQIQGDPSMLSKWKKSAALFQPICKNYSHVFSSEKQLRNHDNNYGNLHRREELDAAEALTFLSRSSNNKLY